MAKHNLTLMTDLYELTMMQGAYLFAAGLPIGIVGIVSGIQQGKAAAAGIHEYLSNKID